MTPLHEVIINKNTKINPIWIMRQAGRYLPEFRKIRKINQDFIELCLNEKLSAEITLQPLKRFNLDGAILFADILLIPNSMGLKLKFEEGVGPLLETVNNFHDVEQLHATDQIHKVLNPIYDTVSLVKSKLNKEVTFIGFAGAPWTVATYMIEGRGSKDHQKTKVFMASMPDSFDLLISKIVDATTDYLMKQIEAGVEVVKLFDSWAGSLPGTLVYKYSLEPMKEIAMRIKRSYPHIPVIVFPRGVGPHYEQFSVINDFDCIALDSNLPLIWAKEKVQINNTVQGNLDPAYLISGGSALIEEAMKIKEAFSTGGHIFNLGHGITPNAEIKHVECLIDTLKG